MRLEYHIIVSGRVQGVGFRWFAKQTAESYGLSGWVKNNSNGNVEIIVQGNEKFLALFADKMNEGPGYSLVSSVNIEKYPETKKYEGFTVLH